MASERIYLNTLENTYWEISSPMFFAKTFSLNFVCMGNKWVGDCQTLHKDLYTSRYEQVKFLAAFLNDRYNFTMPDSDLSNIDIFRFELFFRSIHGFLISVEAIPGGFGFYFYPAPTSFNTPKITPSGKIKFVGTSFRIAERRILVNYRDWETMETKTQKIDLTNLEMNIIKRVICTSILSYMRTHNHFGWSFELSSNIRKQLLYFEY